MNNSEYLNQSGPVEPRYLAFLETITQLRPLLHRYCARMTGSVMDGEDVVQEALFEAYRKLDQFDDSRPLKPWLFRIAHNRCIDFLRRRGVRVDAETAAAVPDAVEAAVPSVLGLGLAMEHLVVNLPPKAAQSKSSCSPTAPAKARESSTPLGWARWDLAFRPASAHASPEGEDAPSAWTATAAFN